MSTASPHDGFHPPDDRFVPVRQDDLVDAIEREAERFAPVHDAVRPVARAIARVIRQEVGSLRHELDARYAAFNPDRDTIALPADRPDDDDSRALREQLRYVAAKANFERLDDVQVEAAIESANSQGLQVRVRPERVRHLDLYVRGRATVRRRRRNWRRPVRGELRDLEVFQRMMVVVQLRDDPGVMLKLFREIPIADVEALLPHAEVLMSRLDRFLIIGGGAGALSGLATKIFWFAVGGAVVASQLLWPAILAMGTLSMRSALGYRRARVYRDSQRTRHLYERNLANNAAVVHTLLGAIAQEETKEATIAWAFLAAGGPPAADETEIRLRIEAWLNDRFGVRVDFDLPDALESLDRLDLWADRASWRVVGPEEAVRRLGEHWRERRSADYHLRGDAATDG